MKWPSLEVKMRREFPKAIGRRGGPSFKKVKELSLRDEMKELFVRAQGPKYCAIPQRKVLEFAE